jgi:hypothetical protein
MLVVAYHDTTALLFISADGGLHQRKVVVPPPSSAITDPFLRPPDPSLYPVDFYHPGYNNWQQYPRGIPDMVGYWAEAQLFGGVVLFDRGESGVEVSYFDLIFSIGASYPINISKIAVPQCLHPSRRPLADFPSLRNSDPAIY